MNNFEGLLNGEDDWDELEELNEGLIGKKQVFIFLSKTGVYIQINNRKIKVSLSAFGGVFTVSSELDIQKILKKMK
ncbi:MAG: hypothetical protein HQ522_22270 [Bacteroidetes bacterium]|nr:hypothetical protein [Bacteroidota bacterium]